MNSYSFDQKQYRNIIKKRNSSFFPIVIILIIILIGFLLIFKTNSNNKQSYHFVQIDSFATYSSANDCCQKLLNQNTQGYIHFDEEYRVLVSFYQTKKQAKNVIEKLSDKYPNAKIYTLTFQKFNGKNLLTKDQNNSIFDINEKIEIMITDLSSLISKYEKDEISPTTFKSKIAKLYDDFIDKKSSLFSSLSKPKFHNHRSYIDKILSSIKNIKDSSLNEQNPIISTRFGQIQIIFNYYHFCDLF